MVHTIKIFVLYVGIIAVIKEHTYDNFHINVSGRVYIYPNPLRHTHKSFVSIEYEFSIRLKREGDSKSGLRESQNGSIISWLVPEGSKTLPVICIGRCQKKLGQIGLFMESLK
jgi:hypothetical protein